MILFLSQCSVTEILQDEKKKNQARLMINEMSVGLTMGKAISSPKIFQIKKQLGEETIVKILTVIIHSFCHSLKVKENMDPLEVVNCARVLAEKYTHDSIKDIILALKEAKEDGKIFYNSVSEQVIYQIVNEYMDRKSAFLENQHYDTLSRVDGSIRTISGTIAAKEDREREEREKREEKKDLKKIQDEKKEVEKIKKFVENNIEKINTIEDITSKKK